jgi:uncharacterized membrane protein YbhN (UPF0104 family)
VLFVGAATGLAAIPGYAAMAHTLGDIRWGWLVASAGGVGAAFAGYLLAWRGIARAGRAGGHPGRRDRLRADPPGRAVRGRRLPSTPPWPCACTPQAPLAAAIAGVFAYRFFSLFAIMPFSFAALPALRSIGGQQTAPSREPAVEPQNT